MSANPVTQRDCHDQTQEDCYYPEGLLHGFQLLLADVLETVNGRLPHVLEPYLVQFVALAFFVAHNLQKM